MFKNNGFRSSTQHSVLKSSWALSDSFSLTDIRVRTETQRESGSERVIIHGKIKHKWAFLVTKSRPFWYPFKVDYFGMGLSGIGPF